MNKPEILEKIKPLFQGPIIDSSTSIADALVTGSLKFTEASLKLMSTIMEIETLFSIDIDDKEIEEFTTIGDIVSCVESKLKL